MLEESLPVQTELDRACPCASELLALLYRQVAALAGPRQDLDDLVQAAAERALRSWKRFNGRCALTTWTYTIAYRTIVDHDRWRLRWRARFVESPPETLERRASDWDGASAVLELERARRLHEVLSSLPAKKRAVVVLVDLEGMAMAEVAQVVGANERTVRSRLRDARKKLAERLVADPLFRKEDG